MFYLLYILWLFFKLNYVNDNDYLERKRSYHYFFLFLVRLCFELRVSHLQSRHSTAWAMSPINFWWLFWRWGLELQSSQSQPPKKLELQMWVISAQLPLKKELCSLPSLACHRPPLPHTASWLCQVFLLPVRFAHLHFMCDPSQIPF
jgi:hypothetical protein